MSASSSWFECFLAHSAPCVHLREAPSPTPAPLRERGSVPSASGRAGGGAASEARVRTAAAALRPPAELTLPSDQRRRVADDQPASRARAAGRRSSSRMPTSTYPTCGAHLVTTATRTRAPRRAAPFARAPSAERGAAAREGRPVEGRVPRQGRVGNLERVRHPRAADAGQRRKGARSKRATLRTACHRGGEAHRAPGAAAPRPAALHRWCSFTRRTCQRSSFTCRTTSRATAPAVVRLRRRPRQRRLATSGRQKRTRTAMRPVRCRRRRPRRAGALPAVAACSSSSSACRHSRGRR